MKLYKLHKWAGLTIGFFLFLLGLSGTLLTYREELLPRFYPELFKVTPGVKVIPVSALYEGLGPYLKTKEKVTNLYTTEEPDEAFLFISKVEDDEIPTMITVNQYTGKIVGRMSMMKNVFAFMLFLHSNFFLGKTGTYVVGIMGLILLFFIATGVMIWLPKKERFQKFKRTLQLTKGRRTQRLHHFLGLILAIPLVVSALTGFLTVFDLSYVLMRPLRSEATRVMEIEKAGTCSWNEELRVLERLTPEVEKKLISIHFCSAKSGVMKISYGLYDRDFLKGYAREIVNPQDGNIIQSFNSEKDPSSWNIKRMFIYPLHTGETFGVPGRVIVLAGGIGLATIYLTGLVLSFKRRRTRRLEGTSFLKV